MSNVVRMEQLFEGTEFFNIDISNWDVSNVNLMSFMFRNSKAFNQNLTKWCVSNISEILKDFATDSVLKQTITLFGELAQIKIGISSSLNSAR